MSVRRTTVEINGSEFKLDGKDWEEGTVERIAPPERPQGQVTQEDITRPSSILFGPFTYGFGRSRIPTHLAGSEVEFQRFFDSTWDTRWPSGIVLPILAEDSTEPVVGQTPAVIGPRDMLSFAGSFYGLFEVAESSSSGIFVCTHNGSAWTGNKTVNKNVSTITSNTNANSNSQIIIAVNGVTVATLIEGTDWDRDGNATTQQTNIDAAITAASLAGVTNSRTTSVTTLTPVEGTWKVDLSGNAQNNGVVYSETLNIQTASSMMVYGGKLFVSYVEGGSHKVATSVDGSTWVVTTGITGSLMTAQSAGDNDDTIMLAEIGGEIVAAVWHEANASITFFTDAVNDNVFEKDEAVDIPSSRGVTGLVTYPGPDNIDRLYVGTAEGLWEVDTAPTTWTLRNVFELPVQENNCRRMARHDGSLWFPKGVGNDQAAALVRFTTSRDRRAFDTRVGPDHDDGLPSNLLGSINWVLSEEGQLWVSISGGAASRNSRILARLDSTGGWHSIAKHGTANKRISAIGFDGARLHYEVRTGTTTSDSIFLGKPLTNPETDSTIKRELTGLLDLPFTNAGMPTIDAVWHEMVLEVDNLSATNSGEHIDATYGKDGEARTANNFGTGASFDFLSGDKDGDFTTTRAGISSIGVAVRLNGKRDGGDNTDTPDVRTIILHYEKEPDNLKFWEFTVNIKEGAAGQYHSGNHTKALAALEAARDSVPNVKMILPGDVDAANLQIERYVRLRNPILLIETEGTAGVRSAYDTFARHGGKVTLRIEEAY